ncbi:catalase [Duganella sp. sic0402]|uniref:catalase n=1 Tax=Duganella sp. sic0402 TaxID=2854786 RepID=UPI001C46911B|nr:catalase [Duganella sp. sic0402]MBV7535018.1 catalase [Duganella sp. sic0402]
MGKCTNTGADQLAAGMPFNATKPLEYGEAAYTPHAGETQAPPDTVCHELSTNQGVPVADNQNSLKAGLRGPTLMEDFILREKITHFDHERIPERVVHARGSAAHGYFESYQDLSDITRAAPFAAVGKRTPVFVRFSTVAGERGSADTVRDVRGFAVKFYTEEGNWDLVGNNIPVFFIQDAMKFPDLIHAVKPEPNNGIPQAASAHDTFWDFASLSPEIAHMLLWHTSDRAIPRSYRMMQGFGVHTFRLVNAEGASVFCKFHWSPLAGTHALVWDEAVRLAGADPDYHRRDLWEAIEAGEFPAWELGLQIFTEEEAGRFPFDILDPTKIVPEEMVAVRTIGKLVLDRNPHNFFSETEQVAFCAAHVVPGIDFTNDPLLQGRLHSYIDTQLTRLGGPNFHEIPINTPLAQIHNNQRDGFHRQQINRGRVSYEPNSLAGGCPFQAGARGFVSVPEVSQGREVRGKPELFADHYAQAKLFWMSQSAIEQHHIIQAFRFELSRVRTPAVRSRTLSLLANIDARLVASVAEGLGMQVPPPLPPASDRPPYDYMPSPSLSLFARPGQLGIRTRRVALMVAPGADGALIGQLFASLEEAGAVPCLIGARIGQAAAADGAVLDVADSYESAPSVLWDGAIAIQGAGALAIEFIKLQYRHGKPILALGGAVELLKAAKIPRRLPQGLPDPGVIIVTPADVAEGLACFTSVLAQHRVHARETDPPRV